MLEVVSSRYRFCVRRSATFSYGISRRGGGERRGLGVHAVNHLTQGIIGDAISVHRELGPGMLESVYEECLAMLLQQRGLKVERQKAVCANFMGVELDAAYRIDLLVEDTVVVEIKAITKLDPVHTAQLNTYLKFSNCEVGLLINFNVTRLIDGLRRVVRGYEDPSQPSPSSAPSARNPVVEVAKPRSRP